MVLGIFRPQGGKPQPFRLPRALGMLHFHPEPRLGVSGGPQHLRSLGLRAAPSELDDSSQVEVGFRPL